MQSNHLGELDICLEMSSDFKYHFEAAFKQRFGGRFYIFYIFLYIYIFYIFLYIYIFYIFYI